MAEADLGQNRERCLRDWPVGVWTAVIHPYTLEPEQELTPPMPGEHGDPEKSQEGIFRRHLFALNVFQLIRGKGNQEC